MLELFSSWLLAVVIGLSVAILLLPSISGKLGLRGQSNIITEQIQRGRQSLLERFQNRLERLQTSINYVHYLLISASVGSVFYFLCNLVLQSWWFSSPAFFAGILFTERLINLQGTRRLEKFEEGNVRAMRVMASSLRTSPSYLDAFEQVADSPFVEKMVANEYRRVVEMLRGQIPIELAMKEFYLRTRSSDVSYLATIVQAQKELGGDLAKTLDLAASSILRRRQIQRRQKAAMSQILAQVNLLSIMPFVFVFSLLFNNPNHFEPLTKTTGGRIAMLASLLSILVGGEVIRFVALRKYHKRGHDR